MKEGRRILLVEDGPDNNRIALRDNGFEIDAFEDPKLALSGFMPNYYDLVILEFRMPHMHDDELYRKLRKIEGKFTVCILSAYGSEEYKTRFSSTTSANDEFVAKVNEVI